MSHFCVLPTGCSVSYLPVRRSHPRSVHKIPQAFVRRMNTLLTPKQPMTEDTPTSTVELGSEAGPVSTTGERLWARKKNRFFSEGDYLIWNSFSGRSSRRHRLRSAILPRPIKKNRQLFLKKSKKLRHLKKSKFFDFEIFSSIFIFI